MNDAIVVEHNLDPRCFRWLWAKYVTGTNLANHCTACLRSQTVVGPDGRRGGYSRRLSKASNPALKDQTRIVLDEAVGDQALPVYICGVSSRGYATRTNYPHNLHAAIVPAPGRMDELQFDEWRLVAHHGMFTRIPDESELSSEFRSRPPEYLTCRIFRWAAEIQPKLAHSDLRGVLLHPWTG